MRHPGEIPQEHRDKMVSAYLGGLSAKESGALLGYSQRTAGWSLKKAGIRARDCSSYRKYSLNQEFFDVIDTESKAHWLGFITADGGIVDTVVSLNLSSRDRGHLPKFLSAVGSDSSIADRDRVVGGKTYHVSSAWISSKKICAALARLGVTERKSLTIEPCSYVAHELLAHYWRGIFDGDGSISRANGGKNDTNHFTICLVGSFGIVSGFREFVFPHVKSRASVSALGNIFTVRYGGLLLPQGVARLLYGNATIFLDRKKEKADKLLSMIPKQFCNRGITAVELTDLYNEFHSWNKVSDYFGTDPATIARMRDRVGLPVSRKPVPPMAIGGTS